MSTPIPAPVPVAPVPVIHIITVEEYINYEGSTFELHERVYMSLARAQAAVKEIKEEKKSNIMCDLLTISIYEIQRTMRLKLVEKYELTRQVGSQQQQQQQQQQY